LPLAVETKLAAIGSPERRRAQAGGDSLHQNIDVHADNAKIITRSVQTRLPTSDTGGHRRAQTTCTPADVDARSAEVTAECCNEPSEDCTGGHPHTCNEACAAIFLPFWNDCRPVLGKDGAQLESTVALCEASALIATSAAQQLNLQCTGEDESLSDVECIPDCTDTLHGYVLLLNINGDDSKLTCELHHGLYSWIGAAGDGGYVGSDASSLVSSVTSGASGTFMMLVLFDAAVLAALVVRPWQLVYINGASNNVLETAPPAWGSGSFEVEVDGSLSMNFMRIDSPAVSHSGGLLSATASDFSGTLTSEGGTIQLRSCNLDASTTIVITGGGVFGLSSMSVTTSLLSRAVLHTSGTGSTLRLDHVVDPAYPQDDMTGTATTTLSGPGVITTTPSDLFEHSSGADAMWSVESGPCEVFNLGRCVGRPHGYGPSEFCDVTARGDGLLGACPTWSFDWTMEAPCFSDAATWDRSNPDFTMGFYMLNMGQCGLGGMPTCPVGKQLSDGDPVFWQSDGAIQGGVDDDPSMMSFQGIGLPANEGPSGLGGGWALCFE
jgi:hypothetical protein